MATRSRLVLLAVVLACGVGVAVGGARLLALPPTDLAQLADPGTGLRVQHLVAQLVLREGGLTSRTDPLTLTAEEANAFLASHLRLADPPAWPLRVQLESRAIEIGGPTTLGRLLDRGPLAGLARRFPSAIRDWPVWLAIRGRILVNGARGELVAESARIGEQTVPVHWLWGLLGGPPRALVWTMPQVVDRVDLEPGRLVVHTHARSSPGRSGS